MIQTSIFLLVLVAVANSIELEAECQIRYDKYDLQNAASRNFMFGAAWPNNEIPYRMDNGYSYKDIELIKSAMRHIESKTCVKWVQHSGQESYVRIKFDKQGCFANLGYSRLRRIHELNLQRYDGRSTCMIMGTAAHEMLHIMGFAHEQTRPDRDQYVKINWGNIKPDMRSNYYRNIALGSSERPPVCNQGTRDFDRCYSGFKTETFGVGYDYGSIMHYGEKYFSSNGGVTMTTLRRLPPGVKIGNREGMTDKDVQKTKAKFNCDGKVTTTRKPSVECRDRYTNCPALSYLCQKDKDIYSKCQISCGQCSEECYDHYSNCGDFSDKCGGNDDIDVKCRLTCGTC